MNGKSCERIAVVLLVSGIIAVVSGIVLSLPINHWATVGLVAGMAILLIALLLADTSRVMTQETPENIAANFGFLLIGASLLWMAWLIWGAKPRILAIITFLCEVFWGGFLLYASIEGLLDLAKTLRQLARERLSLPIA